MNSYNVSGSWQWPDELNADSEIRHRQPKVEDEDEAWEEVPRPTSTSPSEHKPDPVHPSDSTSQEGRKEQPQPASNTTQPPPKQRQRRYKPRQCRICLETVNPTFTFDNNVPDTTDPSISFIPSSVLNSMPNVFTSRPRVIYTSEDGGRLLRPCKCKGTQQYVHEGCLQSWRHADPAYGRRHYWQCPTCGYKYRLQRLGWSRWISNKVTQIALTVAILVLTTFVLGFIADPIINFCMDPYGSVWYGTWSFWSWGSSSPEEEYYNDYYGDEGLYDEDSWIEHFTKGFASLGMVSFLKVILSNPVQIFYRGTGMGGRATAGSGRDRMTSATWLLVVIGALSFLYAVWRGVRAWSRRVLEKASEKVLDVQGADDGEGDDVDSDEEGEDAEPGQPSNNSDEENKDDENRRASDSSLADDMTGESR